MPSQRIDHEITVLDAKGETGVDNANGFDVSSYRHITLSFATDGGADANLTAKVQGSIQETAPTWTSAQSASNMWDYVAMYDLNDPSSVVTGDTGFSVAGADDYKNYIINVDGLKWLNVNITARSEGELTVKMRNFNNL